MIIIHAVTSLDKGGAENHVALLASEQKKKKIKFLFLFQKIVHTGLVF